MRGAGSVQHLVQGVTRLQWRKKKGKKEKKREEERGEQKREIEGVRKVENLAALWSHFGSRLTRNIYYSYASMR